jgi:plastocyanin
VSEGSTGGSVSASGVYTAPATGGTYHVVAASQADPSKTQSATVTVTERILSVGVSPGSTTVTPGGTVQFTATVTTTCGAFTQTQAVAAGAAGSPN